MNLLRPVTEGILRAEGKVVSSSKDVIIAEPLLYLEPDREVAHGSGTFMRSKIRLDEVKTYRL